MQIEDLHCYAVGKFGVLVHNNYELGLTAYLGFINSKGKVPKSFAAFPKPGKDLFVGSYGVSSYWNSKNNVAYLYSEHHVVQDAVSNTSIKKVIIINILQTLHSKTRTFGKNADLGSNIKNLADDTCDIKKILGDAGYGNSLINQQRKCLGWLNMRAGNI